MLFEPSAQLDIFDDSRDVMLCNDVLQALQVQDAPLACTAYAKWAREYSQDPLLADAGMLLRALQARADLTAGVAAFASHGELRTQRLWLLQTLVPAARRLLPERSAQTWLRPFWQDLIARAGALALRADAEQDHAAWMLLQLQDWQAAADAVGRIESWRRIPAPLSWMAQAKLQLHGLRGAWPLVVELAWLAPQRLPNLTATTPAAQLQRLMEQFDADWDELQACEPLQMAGSKNTNHAEQEKAWAWFPAWVLVVQPQHAPDLAQAQPGQHTPAERAFRLLVNLLGLEHQGRHHELIKQRKNLRDLHAGLYAAYMSTR